MDFTVADVLAWARTKPAGQRYSYTDYRNCAVAQFGRETGRPSLCDLGAKDLINLNRDLADAAQGIGHYDQPNEVRWTFGEFAKRLEALCPDTPVTKSDWLSIDAYLTEAVSA